MTTALIEDHIIEHTSELIVQIGKETKWRAFVQINALWQIRFRRGVRKLFADQGDEVLKNLANAKSALWLVKQPTPQEVFDVPKWRVIFEEFGQLMFPEIIEDRGVSEMADLGVAASFDVTNPETIKYVNNKSFKFSQSVNAETMEALQKGFAEALAKGEGIPEIAKRVESIYKYADKTRSKTIARTEVVTASNHGAEQAYIQSGVVEGKEWLNAANPCPWCASLQGKIVALGEPYFQLGDSLQVEGAGTMKFNYTDVGFPSLHPNCECTLLPVLI